MPELRRKTITGYCDPLSARPGQAIDFKVCCYEDGAYDAELVRVIGGDDTPGGTGVIEEVVPAPFAQSYAGRHQAIHTGSHGIVDSGKVGWIIACKVKLPSPAKALPLSTMP
jgi:N,N-dimethylformamidase